MGKSETARMFREFHVPVFDADETVHQLYASGGGAVSAVGQRFPDAIIEGSVDRARLAKSVLGNASALQELEAIVHPLVQKEREQFLEGARRDRAPLVVLDIPLLFETNAEGRFDAVIVVSAPAEVQRKRALERPGMTEEKLNAILAQQVPDEEKRARADFVVDTSQGLEAARAQVRHIIDTLTSPG